MANINILFSQTPDNFTCLEECLAAHLFKLKLVVFFIGQHVCWCTDGDVTVKYSTTLLVSLTIILETCFNY